MLKRICSSVLLLIAVNTQAYTCADIEDLNSKQKDVLLESFLYGYPHNMGYTLAAIVWRESGAGKWKINVQDPSAGIAHNHLKYSLVRLNRPDTSFNRNILAQELIENNQLSLHLAIAELKFWYKKHKGNWHKTRASYNRGYSWMSEKGQEYSNDIKERFKAFRECGTFERRLWWNSVDNLQDSVEDT